MAINGYKWLKMAECLRMSEMLEYGDLRSQAARLYSPVQERTCCVR